MNKQLDYGRTLVVSGLSGLRSGRKAHPDGQQVSRLLTQSARASAGFAALGVCAGMLTLSQRRHRLATTAVCGVAVGAIGFFAALTWKTRDLTATMARSAMKNIGEVRDEHWLERHPVTYA